MVKNYIGQKFGFVTIISEGYRKNDRTYAMCKCDCGKEKEMLVYNLTSGRVTSCGKDCPYYKRKDLRGQKFNFLIAINPAQNGEGWIWKCNCGNETILPIHTVKNGIVKSCGCYQKQYMKERGLQGGKDLTNKKFGKLTALYPINGSQNKARKWKCVCECGNFCEVDSGHLTERHTQSCGCVKSFGELQIAKILSNNDIFFTKQHKIIINDKKFYFDFLVDNYFIEFDGEQHFFARENGFSWNTQENFNRQHNNDLLKNEYCFRNNIPLIRIPFIKINQITIEDLKLETSKYVLTEEKENEYYQFYSK